jgi:protein-tyrosine phosphatase
LNWITDQIAIGNVNDALAPDPAVDFILCLKPGCCADRADFDAVCIPLVDGAGNNQTLIRQALSELNQAVADGLKVLVHCHAGRSRSVSVVARYLMESMGITAEEALALIQQKRGIYLSQGIEEIFNLKN